MLNNQLILAYFFKKCNRFSVEKIVSRVENSTVKFWLLLAFAEIL